MPAPSPSPALIRAIADVVANKRVVVEIDKATGNVRILPPAEKPAQAGPEPKPW